MTLTVWSLENSPHQFGVIVMGFNGVCIFADERGRRFNQIWSQRTLSQKHLVGIQFELSHDLIGHLDKCIADDFSLFFRINDET